MVSYFIPLCPEIDTNNGQNVGLYFYRRTFVTFLFFISLNGFSTIIMRQLCTYLKDLKNRFTPVTLYLAAHRLCRHTEAAAETTVVRPGTTVSASLMGSAIHLMRITHTQVNIVPSATRNGSSSFLTQAVAHHDLQLTPVL